MAEYRTHSYLTINLLLAICEPSHLTWTSATEGNLRSCHFSSVMSQCVSPMGKDAHTSFSLTLVHLNSRVNPHTPHHTPLDLLLFLRGKIPAFLHS